jgi:hypothetical protein
MQLEVVNKASAERGRILANMIEDCEEILHLKYGLFQKGGIREGTLWLRHGGEDPVGLFSCLTVVMQTILTLHERGDLCIRVDNSLGMKSFKEVTYMNTWPEMFNEPSRESIDRLAKLNPFHTSEGNLEKSPRHLIPA